MSPELEAAYRRTTYWVEAPGAWIPLRVDEGSEALDALLAARGLSTCAFVTADNPGSQPLAPEENRRRMGALTADLHAFALLPGLGVGHDGTWPPERSWLVLGIDEAAALSLARRHGQNAILACVRGRPARLRFA